MACFAVAQIVGVAGGFYPAAALLVLPIPSPKKDFLSPVLSYFFTSFFFLIFMRVLVGNSCAPHFEPYPNNTPSLVGKRPFGVHESVEICPEFPPLRSFEFVVPRFHVLDLTYTGYPDLSRVRDTTKRAFSHKYRSALLL